MSGQQPTLFMTWLWQQTPPRHDFNAEKVNRWASQLRANLTIPYVLACVTDTPDGIDSDVMIIEPPRMFEDVRIAAWSEKSLAPQCYRRLALFHPDAREMFGGFEWIVQMDSDMIALRQLDDLFSDRSCDFRIFHGTSSSRPYNGGLIMLRAGSRPQVYEQFARDPTRVATEARKRFVGSDQAVISHILGPGERTFTEADGVYYYSPRVIRMNGGMRVPPPQMRMLFFPGDIKPWNGRAKLKWMEDVWYGRPIPTGESPKPRLKARAFKDSSGVGSELAKTAAKMGMFCTTFTRPGAVSDGIAFVNLGFGSQVVKGKQVVRELHARGILTIPSRMEAELHSNPELRARMLGGWLADGNYDEEEYRVCVVGKYVVGESVKNRRPMSSEVDRDAAVMRMCSTVSSHIGSTWMSYGVVVEGDTPKILDASCSWNFSAFADCQVYERSSLKASSYTGSDMLRIAVETIKEKWRAEQ